MNGVHCQISSASIMIFGWAVSQSGCGAPLPKMPLSDPLSRP